MYLALSNIAWYYTFPQLNHSPPHALALLQHPYDTFTPPYKIYLLVPTYVHLSSFPLRVKVVPAVSGPTLHNSAR